MGVTQLRAYDYIVGVEASAQPDAGAPVLPNDLITLSYLGAYSERTKLVGTYAAPIEIAAAAAIDPLIEVSKDVYVMFVTGDGGPQEMSANPPIVAPGRAGIELTLVGVDPGNAGNTITIKNHANVAQNGSVELTDKSSVTYKAIDATTWMEKSRQ